MSAHKIMSTHDAVVLCIGCRAAGLNVVFTNGCFDLLHAGHVRMLERAAQFGDMLIVGLNSDASIGQIKGPSRPIIPQADRATMLAGLKCVDAVVLFDETEPARLIGELLPDVLVKGGDWAHFVSGRDVVECRGGRVELLDRDPTAPSTTDIIAKIKALP